MLFVYQLTSLHFLFRFLCESRDVQRRTPSNEEENEAGEAVRRAGPVGGVNAPASHQSGLQHPAVSQTLQPWIYTQEVPARTGGCGDQYITNV